MQTISGEKSTRIGFNDLLLIPTFGAAFYIIGELCQQVFTKEKKEKKEIV